MKDGPDIARVAALIGDPARANMLTALMSGKALTASELAGEAGVTLQTASAHLAKLEAGGLVTPRKQGRHKYISLAGRDVAAVLEALMGIAQGAGHTRTRTGPKEARLRRARVCYNHLAGEMGTHLYDSLLNRKFLVAEGENLLPTPDGERFFADFGIDLATLPKARAPLCRECLDWSERRAHLAGRLGTALLTRLETLGWAKRDPGSRAVLFTPSGEQGFRDLCG